MKETFTKQFTANHVVKNAENDYYLDTFYKDIVEIRESQPD